jgi:hypothetical protein
MSLSGLLFFLWSVPFSRLPGIRRKIEAWKLSGTHCLLSYTCMSHLVG